MAKSDSNSNVISVKLRTLRAEYNLTQAEVAEKLGVSQQTYSKYENSGANMDSATIIKICEIYGVSSDYLLGMEDKTRKKLTEGLLAYGKSDYEIELIVNKVLSKINKDED